MSTDKCMFYSRIQVDTCSRDDNFVADTAWIHVDGDNWIQVDTTCIRDTCIRIIRCKRGLKSSHVASILYKFSVSVSCHFLGLPYFLFPFSGNHVHVCHGILYCLSLCVYVTLCTFRHVGRLRRFGGGQNFRGNNYW